MKNIYLLRKNRGVFEAVNVETGHLQYYSNTQKFILDNVIDESPILIIDETFKDSS